MEQSDESQRQGRRGDRKRLAEDLHAYMHYLCLGRNWCRKAMGVGGGEGGKPVIPPTIKA